MKETVREVTPRTSLRSVLRQQAVFEGVENLKFFQVPQHILWYMRRRTWNFFKSQGLYQGRARNSRAYIEETEE